MRNPQATSRSLVNLVGKVAIGQLATTCSFLPKKPNISQAGLQVLQAPQPLGFNPPKLTHPRLDRRSMRSSGLDESCLKRCVGSPSFDIFFVPWITAIQLLVGWWYLPYFFLKHLFVVEK